MVKIKHCIYSPITPKLTVQWEPRALAGPIKSIPFNT